MFQHAVMTYIAHHADLKNEGEVMKTFFSKLDKNGDQRLSREELRNGTLPPYRVGFNEGGIILSDTEFDELFKKLDTSKSGSISYTEYLAGALDLCILTNEKYLEDAFSFFDRDGRKTLDKNEIRNAMNKGWMSETQLTQLFNEVDTNKDEKVLRTLTLRSPSPSSRP